jgi:uncharacterized protein YfbU (UPF0304 family)
MQMSPGEKLIAYMLAEVLERLGGEGEIDPAQIKSLLSGRDTWALKELHPGIFEEPRSPAVVEETTEILHMFRVIDGAVDQLTDEQRGQLDLPRLRFEGFDGNDSDGHLRAARTMIDHLEWYEERQPLVNSHTGGSIIRYRQMLPKFHAAIDANPMGGLSLDQLQEIAAP